MFRLSPQQRCIWRRMQQLGIPNAQILLEFRGDAPENALFTALQALCRRHEALRTTFHRVPGMALPLQAVTDQEELVWRCQDLRGQEPQEQDRQIRLLAEAERQTPFSPEQGPLVRPTLVQCAAARYLVLLTLPALLTDLYSLNHLARELADLVLQSPAAAENAEELQYIEYAEWQNELMRSEEEPARSGHAFWKQQREEFSAPPALPFARAVDVSQPYRVGDVDLALPAALCAALSHFTAQGETTSETVLETLWAALLFRLTEASPLTLGHGSHGRSYAELESVFGPVAKTLPLRLRAEGTTPLSLLLQEVTTARTEAGAWEEYYSPEGEGEEISLPYRFEYTEAPQPGLPAPFSLYDRHCCTDAFELSLICHHSQAGIMLRFSYDVQRYRERDICRIARYYQVLLESALASPETALDALPLLPPAEREQVLVEWNRTECPFPATAGLHPLFEEAVQRTPDAPALVFEAQQFTYSELNARANRLAHFLRARGAGADQPIGLCLERSAEMIVGLLAILKAGGAYLPLDPTLPPERLAGMLTDSGAKLLVTHSAFAPLAPPALTCVLLDRDAAQIAQSRDRNPESVTQPQHLAYVIYTSGSTGQPKGVGIEHRQLLNYIYGVTQRLELPAQASYATVSTLSADLGNTSLFPALCFGGCLHVISAERAMDQAGWREYFSRHAIDCLKIVPSHLSALLGSGTVDAAMLPRRALVLGGEASRWEFVERLLAASPSLRVFNHYGPTETTVGVLTYAVGAQRGVEAVGAAIVPLGRPLPNSRMYVLNRSQQPVPVGVPGELYIGGAGVGRGYLNREALTAEKFVRDPFVPDPSARMYRTGDQVKYLPDGNLEFLGRVDHQVKVRGYRIELGEIESALNGHPRIRESVVVVREEASGEKRLVGYVVGESEAVDPGTLREYLQTRLPAYMIPANLVNLKRMPLTSNGKIDRKALPSLEEVVEKQAYVGPQTPVETMLTGIWSQVLGAEKIGIHDNFFDLGGNSLLALQVHTALRQALQRDFPLVDLFTYPSVHALAKHLDAPTREGEGFASVNARVERQREARQRANRRPS
ncbi:MAG TPA: amino acid adenylation domain-containing protein [Chthonomonadaceae bacterium]|nr:amino acid adenylation domain-containing protein [Chthonomonadaceae bacterium]